MAMCKKCFRKVDKDDRDSNLSARTRGYILISEIDDVNIEDTCLKYREELGILSLLGFEH
jgi:hypothetical protein